MVNLLRKCIASNTIYCNCDVIWRVLKKWDFLLSIFQGSQTGHFLIAGLKKFRALPGIYSIYLNFAILLKMQRCIKNPVKHLRYSVMQKQFTSKSHELFSQNAPFFMFDRVLNTPLKYTPIKMFSNKNFSIFSKDLL